eukprot:TRINITY_DN39114_c0_g1_i2.p1 TRINITY_DN39114_c0_g1~~TRINITY_DN39114_c0_g1_i2.p1  ORF type:complete len:569 (+),score=73.96 TRINITY_DN39114_c0_g1_i2:338-2044(+)
MEDALQGLTIHGAVTFWDPALVSVNSDGEWSGFHYDLMKELATRGGFDFQFHYHPKSDDMGWSDWLYETIELYDVSVEYWLPTPGRMARGAFPTFGIVDTSSLFAAHTRTPEKSTNWLSFLSPLSIEVWLLFLSLAALTAVAYMFAEWNADGSDLGDTPADKVYDSFFFSFVTVTGASTFSPKTWGGKLIAWSWAWCVLLAVSAYTANLAAFLIIKPGSENPFDSLDAALAGGKSVCVWKGTPQEEYLDMYIGNHFPSYRALRQTSKHPMQALVDGDCDAALAAKIEVEVAQETLQMNPCCTLGQVGGDLTFTEGSWMINNDYQTCSMLVRDVLYLHSVAVKESGFLSQLHEEYVSKKSDQHCYTEDVVKDRCPDGVTPVDSSGGRRLKAKSKGSVAGAAASSEGAGGDGEEDALQPDAMAGMFLIHFLFLGVGILQRAIKIVKKTDFRSTPVEAFPCTAVGLSTIDETSSNSSKQLKTLRPVCSSEAQPTQLIVQDEAGDKWELLLELRQQNRKLTLQNAQILQALQPEKGCLPLVEDESSPSPSPLMFNTLVTTPKVHPPPLPPET